MSKARPSKKRNKYGLGEMPASWTWFAGGPLKGCVLARERHRIITWDDSNTIFQLDLGGDLLGQRRFDKEIAGVAISDVGDAIVVASRNGRTWWLDRELEDCFETQFPFDILGVALDPFGYFGVVSGSGGQMAVLGRDGKKLSQFETRPPLKFLTFVSKEGQILGCAPHGLLGLYDLVGRVYWEQRPFSNTGGLAVDGAGSVILQACFGHGLIRFGDDGEKEGTYRTEASPSLVAMDFHGRKILCTTLEQTLVELTYEGTIVNTKALADLATGLAMDALGRYAVIAFQNGELRYFALDAFFQGDVDEESNTGVSKPTCEIKLTDSVEESQSAVLLTQPDGQVLAYTNRRTVRVYDPTGSLVHETPSLSGIGRTLWNARHWYAASTDVNLLAYDPTDHLSVKSTLPLYEVSHVEPLSTFGEFILIQSCEYVSRVILPDSEVWRMQLDHRMESSASQPNGTFAVTLEDKSLRIFDGDGQKAGRFQSKPAEALLVTPVSEGWITLGRKSRVVRGHELDGRLLWSFEVPWATWNLLTVGDRVVIVGVDGSSMLVNNRGDVLGENGEPRKGARYFADSEGAIFRVYSVNNTMVTSNFSGKPIRRWTADGIIHAFDASEKGCWLVAGKKLVFYSWTGS
jgi:hypothetical protein